MRLAYYSRLLVLLLALTGALTSCDKNKCGCTLPPREAITNTSLTRVPTWWLQELTSAGQLYRADNIKDRYSLQFKADGSYVQTILSDNTQYVGTWMLMGADNSTLHLTDHKGAAQEFKVENVNTEVLVYSRTGKDGQPEVYAFKPTR